MDLQQLRGQINEIDEQILKLFEQRMNIASQVADYKIKNGLPVFQSSREQEIIDKVRSNVPQGLENGAEVLYNTIMDISKSQQYQELLPESASIDYEPFDFSMVNKIACPGTYGSYSEIAAKQISSTADIAFYNTFDDVFEAVINGECDYGILPIQNSTAGSVTQTYELMKRYNFYIVGGTRVKVEHCLAAREETQFEQIERALSHEQGLMQCSEFLKENAFKTKEYVNTALAAEFVKNSDKPYAAICSEDCADEMGLKVLRRDIGNSSDNYTRFILISKNIMVTDDADIISVTLSTPHSRSALYRLLTKFSVSGLNLLRLENKPIATKDFDVIFYLDFEGSVKSREVVSLISELSSELSYFKFLGNFKEI
ncbi:MAG: chorismate mutase [Ruminococcus sp.]|nr:chorismate mutase [Ruminococcus sp.]